MDDMVKHKMLGKIQPGCSQKQVHSQNAPTRWPQAAEIPAPCQKDVVRKNIVSMCRNMRSATGTNKRDVQLVSSTMLFGVS